jgi:hypothetical protein
MASEIDFPIRVSKWSVGGAVVEGRVPRDAGTKMIQKPGWRGDKPSEASKKRNLQKQNF